MSGRFRMGVAAFFMFSNLSIKFFNIFKRIRSLSLLRHETTRIALPKGVTSYYVVDLSFFQSDKIKLQQYEKTFGTLHLVESLQSKDKGLVDL